MKFYAKVKFFIELFVDWQKSKKGSEMDLRRFTRRAQ